MSFVVVVCFNIILPYTFRLSNDIFPSGNPASFMHVSNLPFLLNVVSFFVIESD
jgi:hypothetical protein